MKKSVSLLFLLITFHSHAWIIGNNAKSGGEESLCRILYRDPAGNLLSICSGTLVTPTKVITAAHCIMENAPTASVECGYQGVEGEKKIEVTKGGSQVVTNGSKFKETRTDVIPKKEKESSAEPEKDIGVIDLKTAITTIKPAGFHPYGDQEFFQNVVNQDGVPFTTIRDGVECKIEGFGINNDGLSGMLHSAPVARNDRAFFLGRNVLNSTESKEINYVKAEQEIRLDNCLQAYYSNMIPGNFIPLAKLFAELKLFNDGVTHGDSGGPLLCKKKNAKDWNVVGIASQGGYGKADKTMGQSDSSWHVFTQADWTTLIDGKPRPLSIDEEMSQSSPEKN